MSQYESVVVEYLRADKSLFLKSDFFIQIRDVQNPARLGPSWYFPIVAADFHKEAILICEVSYSQSLGGLYKRIEGWSNHWHQLCEALCHELNIPKTWPIRPWLFIPDDSIPRVVKKIDGVRFANPGVAFFPDPIITPLEMVQPWKYNSLARQGEKSKPDTIPHAMKS
jgi:hypothetical protein